MASARFALELSRAVLVDRNGGVVVIKIFMDESGTHAGSPVVTVAAYCAQPRVCESFTKAWNVRKRPIKVFHAADCQNLEGEFAGWEPAERDELVKGLLSILATHNMIGIAVGINLRDFDEIMRGHDDLKTMLGSPYATCFQYVVSWVVDNMEATHNNQSLAFFHETNDFKEEALAAFAWLRENRKKHHGSMTLTFVDKADFVPLQAADVLAYEANKRGRDIKKTPRRSLEAIGDRVQMLGFTKENLPTLVRRLELAREELKVFGKIATFLAEK